MSQHSQAWPITPRKTLLCRRCKKRPATYRIVRPFAHRHTRAAKYRCTECAAGWCEVMGEPKPEAPRESCEPRTRLLGRAETRDLERWARWHQLGSHTQETK